MNYEKNIKILTDFEKALGQGEPVNFQIKNSDGELKKVSKEEFANWMTKGKEEKNFIKNPPKESLVYGVKWDIDGEEYFIERKGKDSFFRESYYQPRSEEEKKQIIERNQKRRKQELEEKQKDLEQQTQNQEKDQTEDSPKSDKQDQQTEKETNQQNLSQKIDNKDNNNKKVFYGIGAVSLVVLMISILVVWVKKKK